MQLKPTSAIILAFAASVLALPQSNSAKGVGIGNAAAGQTNDGAVLGAQCPTPQWECNRCAGMAGFCVGGQYANCPCTGTAVGAGSGSGSGLGSGSGSGTSDAHASNDVNVGVHGSSDANAGGFGSGTGSGSGSGSGSGAGGH